MNRIAHSSLLALALVGCTPAQQADGLKVYDVVRRVRDLVCSVPLPSPAPSVAPSSAPSK